MKSTKKKRPFDVKRYVVSALRRASYRTPMRWEALNSAKVMYGKYRCAVCKEVYARKDVQVDHIVPCIGPTGFVSWDLYIERMFCTTAGLQICCINCHQAKTNSETGARKKTNKKRAKKRGKKK